MSDRPDVRPVEGGDADRNRDGDVEADTVRQERRTYSEGGGRGTRGLDRSTNSIGGAHLNTTGSRDYPQLLFLLIKKETSKEYGVYSKLVCSQYT